MTEGITHLAGPDLLTRVEWAQRIAEYHQLDASLIEVTTTAALDQPVPRPLRTCRPQELASVVFRGVRAGLEAMNIL